MKTEPAIRRYRYRTASRSRRWTSVPGEYCGGGACGTGAAASGARGGDAAFGEDNGVNTRTAPTQRGLIGWPVAVRPSTPLAAATASTLAIAGRTPSMPPAVGFCQGSFTRTEITSPGPGLTISLTARIA